MKKLLADFGFHPWWISWILACVFKPSFVIIINRTPSKFFSSNVGLRQGCSMSPYLFNICADVLSQALRVTVRGLEIMPYVPVPEAPLISHLLFADNCLLLGRTTVASIQGYQRILEDYCLASGQRVNLYKSTIYFNPKMPTRIRHLI